MLYYPQSKIIFKKSTVRQKSAKNTELNCAYAATAELDNPCKIQSDYFILKGTGRHFTKAEFQGLNVIFAIT